MLFCSQCHDVFYAGIRKRNPYDQCIIYGEMIYCPKITCSGLLVEIDENILPIIITLNKKGYETEYCCSSHTLGTPVMHSSIYISFVKDYQFNNLPDDFQLTDNRLGLIKPLKTIQYSDGDPLSIIQKDIFHTIQSLLEWAEGLDDNKGD